ncbi:S1C family serine protease [Staphylococcus gallinarum]|uniref:S1C family serine protease n=1 Tax=Staphylococcus gallinarum TaxID=1293 RepID=UPI002220284F|nr:S1C family serine protease [Staphylococcus gallinarum]MCW0984524.1 S1C family serine protease [Staphylococcus gallinarum]
MANNKKHVIPRAKYGRKRREYFHNEEREQRLQQERQEQKEQAAKEQKLAKNNEERVKDNLRKARIEKLTQEEIQQQQAIAAAKQNETQADAKDIDMPSKQEEDAKNKSSEQLESESKAQSSNEKQQKLRTDKIIHDGKTNKNPKEEKLISNGNQQSHHSKAQDNDAERDGKEKDQPETTVHDTTTDKTTDDTTTDNKKESAAIATDKQQDYFYSEEAQKHRVNKYVDDEKDYRYNSAQNTSQRDEGKQHQNASTKIKHFFKTYWAQILIVVAVILVLTLINAIFYNVDQSGKTKDSIFQSNKDDNKAYTATMKNANNAIHSVVTVDNDTSSGNSSADKETQEADKQNELGSGVVYKKVDDSIYVLTNAHVVGNKKEQKITYGNDKITIGKVIGSDKFSDIAVIKAKVKGNQDVKPMKLGDSSTLVLGEPIIVVGNPLGNDFKGSVSDGIISGLNRHVPVDIDKDDQYDVLMNAFQMDAPVNPGNSGGAVIDRNGKLVGIASLKIDMDNVEGMAFAIPINDAQSIAKQLETKGKVNYPNTGVKIVNVADLDDAARSTINLPNDVNKGIVVADIKKDSLGDKSGLQKNDVIVELDGKDVEDNLRYRQIIFAHKDDLKTLPAKVYRDGKVKDINIKLK